MRITLAIVLFLAGTAYADTAAKPLSAADKKAFLAALRQGRALQGKKDWKGAVAQFQAAAKLDPGDAVSLGELGWTQYLAKDYVAAEASTRRSIAENGRPDTRGATFYNLGLIEEAKGDKAAAIAAYGESLKARPNAVVRRTLAKLDPVAAAAFDVFKVAAMAGPFATIDAYCATTEKTSGDSPCTCGIEESSAKAKRALAAPYTQVEAIAHICKETDTSRNETDYAIAVKTAAGWFAAPAGTSEKSMRCDSIANLAGATARDLAAAAGPELIVTWDAGGSCEYTHANSEWTQTDLQVIGGSKAPFATAVLTTVKSGRDQDESGSGNDDKWIPFADIALSLAWGKGDGSVKIAGKTKGLDATEAKNLVGAHAIVFP